MLTQFHQDENVDLVDVLTLGVQFSSEILDMMLADGDDLFVVREVAEVLEPIHYSCLDLLVRDLDDLHGFHLVGEFVLHDIGLA